MVKTQIVKSFSSKADSNDVRNLWPNLKLRKSKNFESLDDACLWLIGLNKDSLEVCDDKYFLILLYEKRYLLIDFSKLIYDFEDDMSEASLLMGKLHTNKLKAEVEPFVGGAGMKEVFCMYEVDKNKFWLTHAENGSIEELDSQDILCLCFENTDDISFLNEGLSIAPSHSLQ